MPERVKWKRTSVTSVTPYTKGTLVFYVRPVSTLVFCTRPASSSSSMRSRRRNLDTVLTDSIHPSFSFFLSLARSISISLPLSLPFSLSLSLIFFHFSLPQSRFTLVMSIHLFYHSTTHVRPVRTILPSRIVEIAYELIKLHIIYSTYTSAIGNICRSLSILIYSILIILMFN